MAVTWLANLGSECNPYKLSQFDQCNSNVHSFIIHNFGSINMVLLFHPTLMRFSISVTGLFKKGWNEIPEVIGSTFMALIGVGMGVVGAYNYYAKDGDNKKYKTEYIGKLPLSW